MNSEWHYGDTLEPDSEYANQRIMFIALIDDCPHHEAPCLVALGVDRDFLDEPECYIANGWRLVEEAK